MCKFAISRQMNFHLPLNLEIFTICFNLFQHRWLLIAMCFIIMCIVMYIIWSFRLKDSDRHFNVWDVTIKENLTVTENCHIIWQKIVTRYDRKLSWDTTENCYIVVYKEPVFLYIYQTIIRVNLYQIKETKQWKALSIKWRYETGSDVA